MKPRRIRIGIVGHTAATVAAGILLLGALVAPAEVVAHALLRSSEPGAGATLGTAPAAVALTFSETPDPALTSVTVLDSGGTDHVVGEPEVAGGQGATISVAVGALADGVYTVSWRTVSAVDGHISAGSFAFGVGVAPPTGPPSAAGGSGQAGSPAAVVARWILYLGLFAIIGASFVALAVFRRPVGDLLLLGAGGWILVAIGTLGVLGVQWLETGVPLETLLGTSVGAAALARVVALAAVGLAVLALAAMPSARGSRGWALSGLAASAALVVDVVFGHAAAEGSLVPIVVQSAHGVAGAAWLGGLGALLVAARSMPPDERLLAVRRFSSLAGWTLAIVVVSGVARAIAEVQSFDSLLATDFGRVVVAKSAVLLVLAMLGAFNRFISLRTAERAWARLRRVGGVEVTLAVAILGLSGLLVNLTPPSSAGPAEPAGPTPIVATGSDFGTSVRARIVVTPGAPGKNSFELAVVDYDTGEALAATAASVRFELLSQAGVAASTLDLAPTSEPGRFAADGANVAIDGIWRITVTVSPAGGAVEIPLLAATSVAAQPTTTLVSEGLPTIYTVQLGSAGSAQVYLDPGNAGQNELHVTYFDPAGIELPIESATILVGGAGLAGELPAARLLEPGHFVASLEVASGTLILDAVSPVPPGNGAGHVHLHLAIEVQP